MATLESTFRIQDRASRQLRDIRNEAERTDRALLRAGASADTIGDRNAQQSYTNAERGLSRVNKEAEKTNKNFGMMHNRILMITAAVLAMSPAISRLAGVLVQLSGSLVRAFGGAGVLGGGGLAAAGVGLGSVFAVWKGMATPIKNAQTALTAYNSAVALYGKNSKQAALDAAKLNAALKQAPRGTLALLSNVKALSTEWRTATRAAQGYLLTVANNAISRTRGALPQISGMVSANVKSFAGGANSIIDRLFSRESLRSLSQISAGFRRDMPPAADAAGNLLLSFGRLAAIAQPFVTRMVKGFDQWTQRLDISTRDTAYFTALFTDLVGQFKTWEHFLGSTLGLLRTLFEYARGGGKEIQGITAQFDAWTKWMQTNPVKVARFFQQSGQLAGDLGRGLLYIVRLIGVLGTGLDPLWQGLRQILTNVGYPLLGLLAQIGHTIQILGGSLGQLGSPLGLMLRAASVFLGVINSLLSHIPLLGTALAGALVIYGIIRMTTAMTNFTGRIIGAQSGMVSLTAQTNAAASATERLAIASGATGGIPFRAGAANFTSRVAPTNVITPSFMEKPLVGNSRFVVGSSGVAQDMSLGGRVGSVPLVGGALAGGLSRFTGARAGLAAAGARGLSTALSPLTMAAVLAGPIASSLGAPRGVSKALTDVGTGAALGATVGSVVPILGTALGAGIGAAAGGLYDVLSSGRNANSTAAVQQRHLTGFNQRVISGYRTVGRGQRVPIYTGQTIHHVGLQQQINRLGGQSPRTAAQISGQIAAYSSALSGGFIPAAQRSGVQAQLQTLRGVLPQVRAEAQHRQVTGALTLGRGLAGGYNVIEQARGPVAAMEFVRQQALARWSSLGPEGKKTLANALVTWANQMKQANPALAGQFDALKHSIIGKFVEVGGVLHMVNGQILTGTSKEWAGIAAAMVNPVEQARQQISTKLTQIQQKAVGSLVAMGFNPSQANSLVSAMESGGTAGAVASQVASGSVGYGAFTGATNGGSQSAFRHGPTGGPSNNAVGGGYKGGMQPGISSIAGQVQSAFPGLSVTSTVRPGDLGSYHSIGEAVDLAGSPTLMNRAAKWINATMGGSLLEGIHNSGLSIKNGQAVNPGFWGTSTWAAHGNHIHLAAGNRNLGGGGARQPGVASTTGAGAISLASMFPGASPLAGVAGALVDQTGLIVSAGIASRLNSILAGGKKGSAPVSSGPVNSVGARALGQKMAAAYGWTGGQWNSLNSLWTGESGWNPLAKNPSSGAFGIPQALPASKMGTAAVGGDAASQIGWGLKYIAGRYGSPSAAYSAWTGRKPHWYRTGGDFIARTPQLIGVGDTEERVTITPTRAKGGGGLTRTGTAGGIVVEVNIARIDATGPPGKIRDMVRSEVGAAIADVADELYRTGYTPEEHLTS